MKTETLNLDQMPLAELQNRLRIFGQRGSSLCGRTASGEPLGVAVKTFFEDLLKSTTDPEKIKQRDEFFKRAVEDPEARKQLCSIRVETLDNYVLASINVMAMFFEVVNLGDDERPVVQNTTKQEIKVSFVGPDGGPKMVKVTKDDDETLINLHYLTTDRIRYRAVDVYRGRIVDAALATLHLAYDMKNQMDKQCFTLLTDATTGAFGKFIYPGSAAGAGAGSGSVPPSHISDYTFLPNSRINVSNLPTTNDIVLADNTTSTAFRFRVFKAIKKYVNQWAGAFPEGDLMATGRILVPGADASDLADEIVPSGNTNNKVADNLLEQGWTDVEYLGTTWRLVPDNTLTPGACLVELNRKPGRVYLKPSLDRDEVRGREVYELSMNNEEERWSQRIFGAYINNAIRMNCLRVTYTSAS